MPTAKVFLKCLNRDLLHDPTILLLGLLLRGMKTQFTDIAVHGSIIHHSLGVEVKSGVAVYACNPNTCKVEPRGSFKASLGYINELEASLAYVRHCHFFFKGPNYPKVHQMRHGYIKCSLGT